MGVVEVAAAATTATIVPPTRGHREPDGFVRRRAVKRKRPPTRKSVHGVGLARHSGRFGGCATKRGPHVERTRILGRARRVKRHGGVLQVQRHVRRHDVCAWGDVVYLDRRHVKGVSRIDRHGHVDGVNMLVGPAHGEGGSHQKAPYVVHSKD